MSTWILDIPCWLLDIQKIGRGWGEKMNIQPAVAKAMAGKALNFEYGGITDYLFLNIDKRTL